MITERTLTDVHTKITAELGKQLYIGIDQLGENFNVSEAKRLVAYLVTPFSLSFSGRLNYYPKELEPNLRDQATIYKIHDFSDDPVKSPEYKRSYLKSGIVEFTYDYPVSDVKSILTLIGDPVKPRNPLYVCLPGIKIDPEANESYRKNELIMRLCVQNVLSCFGLVNPQFHVFQESYRVQFSGDHYDPQKIFYGNALRRFQLHLAWLFARKIAPEFGVREQEARDIMIDALSEWSVYGLYNKDVSGYVENIEKNLGSKNIGYVILDPWSNLKKYYEQIGEVDSIKKNADRFSLRLMELWKKNLDGDWKKVS